MSNYSVVIPSTGRPRLAELLRALDTATGPRPEEIVVVDDRPGGAALTLPDLAAPVRVLRSGGRGPAAARNTGWRAVTSEWVAFLDDDVLVPPDWPARLADDLAAADETAAATKARITVPPPHGRRPTDDERRTLGLAGSWWITADMAYRRAALAALGGFDERFPRAYREDSDLALRALAAGYRLEQGDRVTTHPVAAAGPLASVRAQAGNADDALMRRKHGRRWRARSGAGRGRLGAHAVGTAAAAGAVAFGVARRPKPALASAAVWAAVTTEFALRRILPGPRTRGEAGRMLLTSVLIPPAACAHRLAGELRARRAGPPAAVLFDRDDTLIVDVPYLADPDEVRPVPGAERALRPLRAAGVPLGVVSNQSGVARGLIPPGRLAAVNARVEQLLGPFQTWQVCPHGEADGCDCRKPARGLVLRAADELGVDVRRCVVIGDTGADVGAAIAAGARGILVPTARTRPAETLWARRHALVARNLAHAVRLAGVR